ncbi:MAG: WXG100 family type VII secretion target [Actinomycetota bacterium]|nr:WXG100 family type VII secretion target [Actinomycetota bacterium]
MLVVDLAALRAAISHMEEFGAQVDECLEEIDVTMAALRRAWHGGGSEAQALAQQQWEDGADQMDQALSALRQIAEAAHRNYSDAVRMNSQMWQA